MNSKNRNNCCSLWGTCTMLEWSFMHSSAFVKIAIKVAANNTWNDESPAFPCAAAISATFVNRKARDCGLGVLHCRIFMAVSVRKGSVRQMNNRRTQKVQHDTRCAVATIETLKSCCIQLGARQCAAMHSQKHIHILAWVCASVSVCVSLECEYPHSFITYSPHSIPQPHPTTNCPIPRLVVNGAGVAIAAGWTTLCSMSLSPRTPPLSLLSADQRIRPYDQRTNCCDLTAGFSDIFAHFLRDCSALLSFGLSFVFDADPSTFSFSIYQVFPVDKVQLNALIRRDFPLHLYTLTTEHLEINGLAEQSTIIIK